ncbi:hypothetical protein [Kitasatospora kifunensis]|uniref:Zinc-finger domain-containing protein n=1 Tax=Kitasatospora kifunensis TaxID=58351 RepID=A0A7W7R2Z5_KITKI|nr:hypothetical protein [Kitasatospora kifunensis]MBB4924472.1 hypothetical protein [Kitasatospora kifunensis]
MTNQIPDPVESASTASHPSVDQLADLHEDLLAAAEATTVRSHLADCAECSDTLAALTELTELLAADQPPAMPQDVAQRLDAALAAAAAEAAPSGPPTASGTPSPAPFPSPPALPALPATPTERRPALTAPPGTARQQSGPGRTRPRRSRARLLAAAVACLAVLGGGTAAVLADLGNAGSSPSSNVAAADHSVASYAPSGEPTMQGNDRPSAITPAGPEFTAAGLPEQIRLLLPTAPSGNLPHASSEQAVPEPSRSAAALPACVASAFTGHQGEQPLLVTHGSYQAAPVDVYVFRISDDPAHLEVFLLTPGCAGTTPNSPAAVRLQEEVPAH